jgi:hypothetical protein
MKAIVVATMLALGLSLGGCTATVRVPGEVKLEGSVYTNCYHRHDFWGRRYLECN